MKQRKFSIQIKILKGELDFITSPKSWHYPYLDCKSFHVGVLQIHALVWSMLLLVFCLILFSIIMGSLCSAAGIYKHVNVENCKDALCPVQKVSK